MDSKAYLTPLCSGSQAERPFVPSCLVCGAEWVCVQQRMMSSALIPVTFWMPLRISQVSFSSNVHQSIEITAAVFDPSPMTIMDA